MALDKLKKEVSIKSIALDKGGREMKQLLPVQSCSTGLALLRTIRQLSYFGMRKSERDAPTVAFTLLDF